VSGVRPTFNVGGLASGLDTNTIIDQLMAIERQPLVRLQQRELVEQARQNALRDVQTRLQNLKTAADALRAATIWNSTQTVASSDPTKVDVSRFAGAAAGAYDLTISQLARAHQITQGSALQSASASDVLHIQLGSGSAIDVAIASGDSLQTIADKINGTTDIPVYASVVNSKLVLTGKATGAANTISVTSDGTLAGDLGFATTLTAQDAQYTLDGVAGTSASNTIKDAIVGLSLTLKSKTTSAVTITVGAPGADNDAIESKVQGFVDQWNSTIDFIRSKLDERKVANPTTNDDRVKGVLAHDPGLESLLSTLRAAVADVVSGRPSDASLLSQVGVSTGAATGSSTTNPDAIEGKLTLDTSKLDAMLENRLSDVKALFTNLTGSYASEGLSQRIDRILDPQVNAVNGVLGSRISSEDSILKLFKDQEDSINVRLDLREQQLRAQFTAMETALSQLQSLNASVAGQFARLSTSILG
jgi:flagellar hook-associated protein 2